MVLFSYGDIQAVVSVAHMIAMPVNLFRPITRDSSGFVLFLFSVYSVPNKWQILNYGYFRAVIYKLVFIEMYAFLVWQGSIPLKSGV